MICRKAYRLGKWLSDLNTLRNTPVLTKAGSLEILASGGEGVYYFVEQLTWYAKPHRHQHARGAQSSWGSSPALTFVA